MPRLPYHLLRLTSKSPLLQLLLRECRDLESARNELRWLREHAISSVQNAGGHRDERNDSWKPLLRSLCVKRASGKPLQYLLGSEFFGDIEVACKPGVLIPRPETAAAVTYFAERLCSAARKLPSTLRVLDLCCGTGCIPLLFQHVFAKNWPNARDPPHLSLVGADISADAVQLAEHNRLLLQQSLTGRSNAGSTWASRHALDSTAFFQADVLRPEQSPNPQGIPDLMTVLRQIDVPEWDILISNPPYISSQSFHRDTQRSVRLFEPKTALVPPRPGSSDPGTSQDLDEGDTFYPRLLQIAQDVGAKIVLMEVADLQQASRVAALASDTSVWDGIEIWRDHPRGKGPHLEKCRGEFPVRGSGHGRSVVCWRGEGTEWLQMM
ncbi:S-adenosyl-L-methionine-dependent methyltransferase [Rhizodiscina lignyota]|uniref:S-adenosyl-L-methionine-dependent methyltransferase n=1 Tax=Rhizodiscina lignyota TaxID=1504668 RepID=A0A9P4IF01_9PEZI|nr:S-adenosyl-L-methionine-dependent methyltransferase [Rhizodiscina lignyota]